MHLTHSDAILRILPFLRVRLQSTELQMSPQIVEQRLGPGYHHATRERQEAPVLHVDPGVGVRLVRGLLNELHVELITEGFLLQTLRDDHLDKNLDGGVF